MGSGLVAAGGWPVIYESILGEQVICGLKLGNIYWLLALVMIYIKWLIDGL